MLVASWNSPSSVERAAQTSTPGLWFCAAAHCRFGLEAIVMRNRPQVEVEPDVYRSAWNFIRNKAEREAAKFQEQVIAKGDTKAISMWWSIHLAIKELRRTKRQEHEPLN
jgi:hypothetical protein